MTQKKIYAIARELKFTILFVFHTTIIFKDKTKKDIVGCFSTLEPKLNNENKWNFIVIEQGNAEGKGIVLIGDEVEDIIIRVNPDFQG